MKDFILTTIVDLAEAETPVELDITLMVSGFLVSGYVTSYIKFMEHTSITSAMHEGFKKAFADLPKPSEPVDSDVAEDSSPDYIHLRDAKCFTPATC